MKQEILKFKFKLKSKDFFVNKNNYFAYSVIRKWPNWENPFVYIYGPNKCGKTFMSQMWKKKSQSIYVSSNNFENKIPNNLDIEYVKSKSWILDGVDKIIEQKNDNSYKVLNLINIIKANANSYLLMTASKSPKFIECELADLTSRIMSSIVIEVSFPSQELLCQLIKKYLNDRNIELSKKCIQFISERMERSYDSAFSIAEKIDLKSMENKSKITTYFLKSLFEC